MATKKSAGDSSPQPILEGVTLSRTLPPLLPANFLSRSLLVESVKVQGPGTTLITGPVGYGKTSLATEIAQRNPGRTFWYTMLEEDLPAQFNAHLIQAVRNVIPDFAPWFSAEIAINPMELLAKFSNELASRKGEYIFIVDNRRTSAAVDFATANQVINSLPRNLHFVHIRRFTAETSVTDLALAGNLQVIGPSELKFTSDEVAQIASLNGLSPVTEDVTKILESAQGWPAAVQLIARGLSKGEKFTASAEAIANSIEPLRFIVDEIVRGLSEREKSLLAPLSALPEFTSELAQQILGKRFSQHEIDSLAFEGALLSKSIEEIPTYRIHSLIREFLYLELSKDENLLEETHQTISQYFEENLDTTTAMEHAFLSQDHQRFEKLFRDAARIFAISGRGDQLLRWARYAGDESAEGQLQRQTVEIAGHLANLSLNKVEALNASMRLQSRGTNLEAFMQRFSSLIEIALNFSYGQFADIEAIAEAALQEDEYAADSDFTDTLFVLRRLAGYYFVTDNVEKLEEIDLQAKNLLARKFSSLGHVHQLAIRALCAYQQSYYQEAFESSRMALSLSESLEMASFQAPLDIKYIFARCHYEFTEIDRAYEIFHDVIDSASRNQQWVWYCSAASFTSVSLAQRGDKTGSVELLRAAREKVSLIHVKNQLNSILDRGELVIQLISGDLEKMKLLLETSLSGRTTELIRLHILRAEGKEWDPSREKELPERTPRQRIYKYLSKTVHAYETDEELALAHLTHALKIGSEVGAKAVFIRQMELYPLFHKVASRTPTFYNEEISRKVAARMQEIDSAKGERLTLTKREIEIVRHLDSGKPITSIGASLHISHNTMKTHLKNIYRKMAVDGRDQAVEKAKSLGLI